VGVMYRDERQDGVWEVDKSLYFCRTCRKCWERVFAYGDKNKKGGYDRFYNFIIYEDFPTIGKARRKCPQCKLK